MVSPRVNTCRLHPKLLRAQERPPPLDPWSPRPLSVSTVSEYMHKRRDTHTHTLSLLQHRQREGWRLPLARVRALTVSVSGETSISDEGLRTATREPLNL